MLILQLGVTVPCHSFSSATAAEAAQIRAPRESEHEYAGILIVSLNALSRARSTSG